MPTHLSLKRVEVNPGCVLVLEHRQARVVGGGMFQPNHNNFTAKILRQVMPNLTKGR